MEYLLLHSFNVSPVFNAFSAIRQVSYLLSAKNYMKEVFQCKVDPCLTACRQFCEFQIQFSRKPMLREFIQFVYRPCSINCEYVAPIESSIQILEHLFVEYGIIANCQLVYFCYTYLQFEQRYPTNEELVLYIDTEFDGVMAQDDRIVTQWMNQEVEQYWNQKRSTVDLSILRKEVASEEKSPCCICQEAIEDGQLLIRLPCNHVFHSEQNSNCSGIEPWLQKTDTCPLCKKSVSKVNHENKENEERKKSEQTEEKEDDIPDLVSDSSDNASDNESDQSDNEEEDVLYLYGDAQEEEDNEE